jgi:hypothetical protein
VFQPLWPIFRKTWYKRKDLVSLLQRKFKKESLRPSGKCVCVCVYIYIYVCVYIHTYVYIHTHTHTQTHFNHIYNVCMIFLVMCYPTEFQDVCLTFLHICVFFLPIFRGIIFKTQFSVKYKEILQVCSRSKMYYTVLFLIVRFFIPLLFFIFTYG